MIRISRITCLAILPLLLFTGCEVFSFLFNNEIEEAKRPQLIFEEQLIAVGAAYHSDNFNLHLAETKNMLNLSRQVPIIYLGWMEALLMYQIEKDGIQPYYSILIDYIERYASVPQDSTIERFNNFTDLVWEEIGLSEHGYSYVMVQSAVEEGPVLYRENLGAVLTMISTSMFGKAQFRNGLTADLFTRLIASSVDCNKMEEEDLFPSQLARQSCEQLKAALEGSLCNEKLEEGETCAQGKTNLEIAIEYVNDGGMVGKLTCFQKEAPSLSPASQFMQYVNCLSGQFSQPFGNFDVSPYANSAPGDYYPHTGGSDAIRNLLANSTYKGQSSSTTPHDDGISTQYSYDYLGDNGSTIQVIDFTTQSGDTWANSTSSTGSVVVINGNNGTSIYHYDNNGNLLGTQYDGDDGNGNLVFIQTSYQDNGSIDKQVVASSATGTVTVTEYDDQGNVAKETKYAYDEKEEKMKCVSGCDDPATFIDDTNDVTPGFEFNPCYDKIYGPEGLLRELKYPDPSDLGPWIQPDPEKVTANDISECLNNMSSQPIASCGPSVVLCLDDVDDACTCIVNTNIKIQKGGNCNAINCGEGATCDPATGMCITADKLLFPGIFNPLPAFHEQIQVLPEIEVGGIGN